MLYFFQHQLLTVGNCPFSFITFVNKIFLQLSFGDFGISKVQAEHFLSFCRLLCSHHMMWLEVDQREGLEPNVKDLQASHSHQNLHYLRNPIAITFYAICDGAPRPSCVCCGEAEVLSRTAVCFDISSSPAKHRGGLSAAHLSSDKLPHRLQRWV